MNKPENSHIIRDLEDKLKSDDYSHRYSPVSAFLIDVMAAVRRVHSLNVYISLNIHRYVPCVPQL